MSHKVQIASGQNHVALPDGNVYNSGDTVTLTDDQFTQLGAALFPGTVVDLGYLDARPTALEVPERFALAGTPATGILRESMGRHSITTDLAALTTQVMLSVALFLEVGETVTNLSFKSGATAAVTPTNWWFALYDTAATPAKLAQTADQLTAAWAANTTKTVALTAPVKVSKTGIYYAAVMVKATTTPSLIGASVFLGGSVGVLSGAKVLAQTSGSALVATAPATIATPTAVGTVPIAVAT
jgi:hypothetical protein